MSFLFSSGMTTPTALAAPVLDWDDVFQNAASAAPVLVGRAVNGLLRGGGGVHGGHQARLMPHLSFSTLATGPWQLVVQDALEMMAWPCVGGVVHAVDEHGVSSLGREDDLFGAGGQVWAGLVQEDAGGFDDHVGTDFTHFSSAGSRS